MSIKLSSMGLQDASMNIAVRWMNVCLLMVIVMVMEDLYIVMVHITKAFLRRI